MRAPVGSTQKKYRKNRGPSAHFRDLWPPTTRTARSYLTLLVSPDLGRDQSLRKINKPKSEKNQSLRDSQTEVWDKKPGSLSKMRLKVWENPSIQQKHTQTPCCENLKVRDLRKSINPEKTHTNTVLWKSQSSRSEKIHQSRKNTHKHRAVKISKFEISKFEISKFEIARSLSSGFTSCYVVLTFSLSLGFCSLVICATKKRGELYPPEG